MSCAGALNEPTQSPSGLEGRPPPPRLFSNLRGGGARLVEIEQGAAVGAAQQGWIDPL